MTPENLAALQGQPAPVTTPAPAPASAPVATQIISPPPINPGQPATAPVVDPVVVKPDTSKIEATPAPVKTGPSEQPISDDLILKAVKITETPEMELNRTKLERSAEAKENRRLLEREKWLNDILKNQGIVITENDQKLPEGLLATPDYSREVKELNIQFKDLSEEKQELFATEPQKAIRFLEDKFRKAFARIVPTTEQANVPPVPTATHEGLMAHYATVKRPDGELHYQGLSETRRFIESELNSPDASQALRDFYRKAPGQAIALLHAQYRCAIDRVRSDSAKITAEALTKAAARDANPTLAPSGGGVPSLGEPGGGSYADQLAAEMRKTRLNQY